MGFMKKEKIINKVKTYLTENRINFEEGTIEYIGIRENYEIEPGNPKKYFYVSFESVGDVKNIYSTDSYFIYIDYQTENLSYLIGPRSFTKIDGE